MNPAELRRYKALVATQRRRAAALLVLLWDRLEKYDDDDMETYARLAEPSLVGAKTAAVAVSVAFTARALGVTVPAIASSTVPVEADLRAPFLSMRHALAMERPFDEAVRVGRSTADATGSTFVQSTTRRTGDLVAEAVGKRPRWVRTPGAGSCPWCLQAAQTTYASSAAADFGHDRCDCDAVPA